MAYTPVPTDATQPADTVLLSTAAAEFRALKAHIATQLAALQANVWQTGDIRLALSSTVPAGWLRLPVVATTILRATYPALTAWIVAQGSPWGAGDGSVTIGMPYIPEGYAVGNTAVAGLGTNTAGSVIAHTHTGVAVRGSGAADVRGEAVGGFQQWTDGSTQSTGGSANLPAVTYTAFLIKT